MLRQFPLLALGAMALLVPRAHGRELTELRERVRDAVQRTDKDLDKSVPRDKLNDQQREHLDAAVKDLRELGDAVTTTRWEKERDRMVHAVDNIDFLEKNAPIGDDNKQVLGIDLFTLRTILDSWEAINKDNRKP